MWNIQLKVAAGRLVRNNNKQWSTVLMWHGKDTRTLLWIIGIELNQVSSWLELSLVSIVAARTEYLVESTHIYFLNLIDNY